MSNTANKDFNLVKAEQLCLYFIKVRQAAKTEFISELIKYQHFFGEKSIVNCKLMLSRRYLKRTAQSVLADLGHYKIVSFYNQTDYEYHGTDKHTYSVITFTTAGGS